MPRSTSNTTNLFLCALVPLPLIVLVTACGVRPGTSATDLIATPTVIQDAWTEVRVALPEDIPVFSPTWMPARFGAPILVEAQGAAYTILYMAPDEQIAFILGQGAGAWGNAPPPDTLEPLTMHGMNGVLHISTEAKFIGISWLQQGRPYQIKSISARVTREEMRQIVDSLTAVRPFTPARETDTVNIRSESPQIIGLECPLIIAPKVRRSGALRFS
jgi:hypothetical protein